MKLMRHAAQFFPEHPVSVLAGTVPGVDLLHAGLPHAVRQRPDIFIGLIVQVEAADHGPDPSPRVHCRRFPDNIVRTSVGAAVEYNDAVLQFEYQALLMGKTVDIFSRFPAFSSPGV